MVRPATDTVTLSSSGTATMNITVQNNMGFALINFVLTAKIGNTAIAATRQTGKISGTTLHPGERAQYALAVTGTAGGSVPIENISFFVSFGNSGETACYPTKGANAVMVKKTDGTLSLRVPRRVSALPLTPEQPTGELAPVKWTKRGRSSTPLRRISSTSTPD